MKNAWTQNTGGSAEQKTGKNRLKTSDFCQHLFVESYGVKVKITSNASEAIAAIKAKLEEFLPNCFREISGESGDGTIHNFLLVWNRSGKDSIYKNGARVITRLDRAHALDSLCSAIRLTVAEFAVERVFLHAEVVGWKNRAIVIPGSSFSGKTSLTAALVKRGATYYSDEYAVLDSHGLVHSFPKNLSMRGIIDRYQQVELPVEEFGGVAGVDKIPIGMVLLTRYKPFAKWNPKILSPARGTLEIIKDTIPIRHNPAFTLKVLNRIASDALTVKSARGDVAESADRILDFFEKNCLITPQKDE